MNPRKPYKASHVINSKEPKVTLRGQNLKWISQFKYLGHIISNDLCDVPDIRRVKRSMYYMTNMLYSTLRHANKGLLIKLFKSYCTHMHGCELQNVNLNRRSFREMHVAYHRCVKKLINVLIETRSHELCP